MKDGHIYELLSEYTTSQRREIIDKTSALRTRYITIVLEDLHHAQNISAVLRTCDCFGLQDVHIIENTHNYQVNPKIVRGSDRWLDIHKYSTEKNNSLSAIKQLKEKGYRIVATSPHNNDTDLNDFDLQKGPAAFFFGTEQSGISETILADADEFVKVPMQGFTESLNVSVTVGILVHHLTLKLRESAINWQLDKEALDELRLRWMRQSVKRHDLIEQRLLT